MATMEISRRINAPRERVFEVFTDLSRAPDRIEAIKQLEILTDGPVGKGTRFRETRVMFGKEATETMEISDFRPSQSYTISANSCGSLVEFTFDFAAEGSATNVVMRMKSTPQTLMAKVLSPLGIFFSGMMRKCMEADMSDLARAAESGD